MERNRIKGLIFPLVLCIIILLLISCSKKSIVSTNQLDTPGHHTYTGLKLLELRKFTDAKREFQMAVKIDPHYSRAYTGMALVNILQGEVAAGWENLEYALKNARDDDEKLFVYDAKIQYYYLTKMDEKWLELSRKQFENAVALNASYAPVYYYMGLAYKDALEFDLAVKMFSKVIELKTEHLSDAEEQLAFLQKIKIVNPETSIAKKIALKQQVTRADIAALFVRELKIKKIYNSLLSTGVVSTEKENTKEVVKADDLKTQNAVENGGTKDSLVSSSSVLPKALAKDIVDHPYKSEIEEVLVMGIRGLGNDEHSHFRPDEILSRGELAVILEDILIKITGEKDLAAMYVSPKSLFPDVASDMPYFNSIVAVTSQGIMEAKNPQTKEFAPLKTLSGIEVLGIIKK